MKDIIERIRVEYHDNFSRADRLRIEVVNQLHEIIKKNEISLGVPIESRVKTLSSIEEKIERKSKEINSPLELTDLIGIRTILLFQNDLETLKSAIKSSFTLISEEDTSERLGDSEFGYQSQHLIIKIPSSWQSVPTFEGLDIFHIEVQVRTLAQHIWAAVSHKLQYKQEAGVPQPIRRAINRASALLETVDLEFSRVLNERQKYIAQLIENPPIDELLNADNILSICSKLLPPENKDDKDKDGTGEVLQDLLQFGIRTKSQLEDLLNNNYQRIIESDSEHALNAAEDDDNPFDQHCNYERVKLGHYFTHIGLIREALRSNFGEQITFPPRRKYHPIY